MEMVEPKRTIGASRAAAILGLSPFYDSDIVTVWREIMGLKNESESKDSSAERKRIGLLLEDDIYDLYTERTGIKVVSTQVKKTKDFLHATVDGIREDGGIVEAKTAVDYPSELPLYYRVQVLLQMYVHDIYKPAHVAFFGGMYFKIFTVEYNEEEVQKYVERLKWFYDTYVATGIEPPPTTHAMFRKHEELETVNATDTHLALYKRYIELQEQSTRLQNEMNEIRENMKKLIPVGTKVIHEGNPIIYRQRIKGRLDIDKARLENEYPEVYYRVVINRGDYDRLIIK